MSDYGSWTGEPEKNDDDEEHDYGTWTDPPDDDDDDQHDFGSWTNESTDKVTDDGVVGIGECPKHGFVFGDDIEYNFPARCECGLELKTFTTGLREEIVLLDEYLRTFVGGS